MRAIGPERRRMTIEEANERVRRGVDELEEILNQFNNTPGLRDEVRRADLSSLLMSFIMDTYGLAAPALATAGGGIY